MPVPIEPHHIDLAEDVSEGFEKEALQILRVLLKSQYFPAILTAARTEPKPK